MGLHTWSGMQFGESTTIVQYSITNIARELSLQIAIGLNASGNPMHLGFECCCTTREISLRGKLYEILFYRLGIERTIKL